MIDKKILVEFLRLKWNEIKDILLISIFVCFSASLGIGLAMFTNSEYFKTEWVQITVKTIGYILLTLFVIYISHSLVEWLKSNWKQATLNVYPKRRKK